MTKARPANAIYNAEYCGQRRKLHTDINPRCLSYCVEYKPKLIPKGELTI